ncbi:MAG: ribosomal L7Ae/L30e/S12e/Gadd45 family protein [Clostridia bacterium]|nr:ribosomal L7Ae/L30e/S12e/Gadd45 family protein [Clostridia bacterium]
MVRRFIGLCMAAGGVKVGFDLVLGEVRSGRAKFLIIANDASERTVKQLTDKCKYYGVKYYFSDFSSTDIADMIGKRSSCAAAAFTGRGPWKSVKDHFEAAVTPECSFNEDRKDD